MKAPLVSIIMPAYCQATFIAEAIESVCRSSFEDWELIVVDDGSPDNVAEIVCEKAKRDSRIRFFHTENSGVSAARNFGVAQSAGEYLLFLDADDTIEPEYVERCVECLSVQPQVTVVYCQWRFFGDCGETPEIHYEGFRAQLLKNHIFITAMIRRSRFLESGGFDLRMRSGLEDWEFWIRYLEDGGQVVQLPERMFNYRIKAGSKNDSAHRGLEAFNSQLYILEKHRELYCREYGAPLFALEDALVWGERSHRDLERIRKKYDAVFYRRIWRVLKALFVKRKTPRDRKQ